MVELHDLILGAETWNISLVNFDILSQASAVENISQPNSSLEKIQNFSKVDIETLKEFHCFGNSSILTKIEDTAGLLLSPNYPQNYYSDAECHWELKVPNGTYLEIQFWSFDVTVSKQ